eukprot:TRINITY_DN19487_c0_g1_i2.p3 TRINITY_DN19487_c0_g1~~TRINITY_DN19487_c0_g1_i2.p3  ORF type:complete len:141 (-),score=5.76 TRINITY_DN19487_c0_g1_i2:198-620(-)
MCVGVQCCVCFLFFNRMFQVCCFFFFSSRRRHTRCREVSWARRCVQETDPTPMNRLFQNQQLRFPLNCAATMFRQADQSTVHKVIGVALWTEAAQAAKAQSLFAIKFKFALFQRRRHYDLLLRLHYTRRIQKTPPPCTLR